jgi:putative MFS transporter
MNDPTTGATWAAPRHAVLARIDRLPRSRYLAGLVGRIAAGGWFEFYELFMPGFISLGLIKSGIFTQDNRGLFDLHSFASFLASFFLGMFLSTAIFGFVSDRLGRRTIFIWSMLVYSAAQLGIGMLSDPAIIDLFRLIAGLAVGMQLINNDSYMIELTPRNARGRYMTLAYVFILTAVPVAALFAAVLVPLDPLGIAGWRFVVLAGGLGGVVVWLIQRGLPESPRWLEVHGRLAEADDVVAGIERRVEAEHGTPLPSPEYGALDAAPEHGVLDAASEHGVLGAAPEHGVLGAASDQGRWTEMFSRFYLIRTIAISIFQFCQPIAVFGFTAFVPILLVKQGFTIVRSLDYTLVIVLLTPVGALLGFLLSERIERKWQLVLAPLLIGASGILFASARSVPLILVSGGLIAVGNNWMTAIFHPYAAELFPTRIRARAVGLTFSWSRVSSVFVGYWVSDLLASYGPNAVFAMIGAAMLTIILTIGMFGPRTNGQSLEILSP